MKESAPSVGLLSMPSLLRYSVLIVDELKRRGVARTGNNPVGDYAEWLVAESMDLSLSPNSEKGADAVNSRGERFQIKGRRCNDPPNAGDRQLSVFRGLADNKFDYLVGVLFNHDFTVAEAYRMPHATVKKYSRFNEHQNGHILHLRGDVLKDATAEDISHVLRTYEMELA